MMVKTIVRSVACLSISVLLASCTGGSGDGGLGEGVVAEVDGQPITREQLEAEISRRGLTPAAVDEPEERLALLDALVEVEVLHARALEAGFDRDPETARAVKRLIAKRFRTARLEERESQLEVSDDEVRRWYEEHIADYTLPGQFRAAMIQIAVPQDATDETVRKLRARAESAHQEASRLDPRTRDLGTVVRRFSDHRPTRRIGGDLGWLGSGAKPGENSRIDPTVHAAIEALHNPGDLAPVVRGEDGAFYVVKLIERRPARSRPFEEVARTIRARLEARRGADAEKTLREEARAKSNITIDRKQVEALSVRPAGEIATGRPPVMRE